MYWHWHCLSRIIQTRRQTSMSKAQHHAVPRVCCAGDKILLSLSLHSNMRHTPLLSRSLVSHALGFITKTGIKGWREPTITSLHHNRCRTGISTLLICSRLTRSSAALDLAQERSLRATWNERCDTRSQLKLTTESYLTVPQSTHMVRK